MQRRNFLSLILGATMALLCLPINALAAVWNRAAFETNKVDEAIKSLGVAAETTSQDILITAPEKAENGAIVQIEVKSNLANTESISILVEKNPTPLIAHFKFSQTGDVIAEPFVVTRIKMAETSDVKVIVKAGEHYFANTKNIIVLENGCG